jgi:hypothetical protein
MRDCSRMSGDGMKTVSLRSSFVLAVLALGVSLGAAQATGPDGATLAALFPATLGGLPRGVVNAYSNFATTSYREPSGDSIVLQFHEVRGAGAADYQRSICPSLEPVSGHPACISHRHGTEVSWVLGDVLQINVGGPNDAAVRRLADALDLAPLVRLAH